MSRARHLAFALVLLPALAFAQPRLALAELPAAELAPALGALKLDEAQPPHTPRAGRLLLEALGGAGAAVAFGIGGGATGLLIACPSGLDHSPDCLQGIAWGALAGVALAAPAGVFLTGHLLRGGGSYIPTMLGGLVGIGAVLLIAPYAAGILPLLVFGLPVVGSLGGYELSASWHAPAAPPPVGISAGGGGSAVTWSLSF